MARLTFCGGIIEIVGNKMLFDENDGRLLRVPLWQVKALM
jgi:hypothetical protein